MPLTLVNVCVLSPYTDYESRGHFIMLWKDQLCKKYIIFIQTIIFGNIIICIILLSLWQNPLLVELIYVIKMFREVDIAWWCRTSVTNIFYNRVLLKNLTIPIYFVGTLNNTRNVVKHSTPSFLRLSTSGQRYRLGRWQQIHVKLGDSQFQKWYECIWPFYLFILDVFKDNLNGSGSGYSIQWHD